LLGKESYIKNILIDISHSDKYNKTFYIDINIFPKLIIAFSWSLTLFMDNIQLWNIPRVIKCISD